MIALEMNEEILKKRSIYRKFSFKIIICSLFLMITVLCAIFAPYLTSHNPTKINLANRLRPPVWIEGGERTYYLGTDHVGRDVLSRVIYGARISLPVGLLATIIGGIIGTIIGIPAGYFRGRLDSVVTKIIDIQLAFPFILLAISIAAVLGPSLRNLIIVLGLKSWVVYARIGRGSILSVKEMEFVETARATGCSHLRIILRHILPNILSPLLVIATLDIGQIVILEATLSFLGLGVQPPTPSWGSMLSDGSQYINTAWWVVTFPGLAIMFVVLSFNIIGDGLRDRLDPNLRQMFT